MPRSPSGWPTSVERQIGAHLRRRSRLIRAMILATLDATPRSRTDADDVAPNPYRSFLGTAVERLRAALSAAAPLAPAVVRRWARSVDVAVSAGIARALGLLAASSPPTALERAPSTAIMVAESAWVAQTLGRVEALESDTISRALTAAWTAADVGEDPVKAARVVLDAGEVKALLLARDSVGLMVAAVNAVRGPQMGATSYVWVSQHDSRVRARHAELDGTVHLWSAPGPDDGFYPGQAPFCRCTARAVRAG